MVVGALVGEVGALVPVGVWVQLVLDITKAEAMAFVEQEVEAW